jgi:hypothetical protein
MNIAYLILAYHQPGHVARMIRRLDDGAARFFVHVDRKVDLEPFRRAIDSPRVAFAERRVEVNWGGWNMVQATLDLLAQAAAADVAFDYFQLLSDSCYPIRSNAQIRAKLADRTKNYITINHAVDASSPFLWWIREYHFPDFLKLRTFERHAAYHRLRKLVGRVAPRRPPQDLRVYKGWQWWCLNAEAVRYVLEFVRTQPAFVRYFRHVRIPDEMFFHTILAHSPFAASLEPGFGDSDLTGNHYIRWSSGRPATLDEDALPALAATPACFARKFSETASARLIARLSDDPAIEEAKPAAARG